MLEYFRFKIIHDLFVTGKLEEARQELALLQRHYVATCDETTTLKMQVQEYEDILYLARNLTFDGEFYWLETGSIKQGPFCPHCYDQDGLLMRLSGERHNRYCTACRVSFRQDREIAANMDQEPMEALAVGAMPLIQRREKSKKVIPFAR